MVTIEDRESLARLICSINDEPLSFDGYRDWWFEQADKIIAAGWILSGGEK